MDGASEAPEAEAAGTVERVFKEKTGDFTIVSFLLEDGTNYIVSSESNPLAIYLEAGDAVNITYADTGELFLPVKVLQIQAIE